MPKHEKLTVVARDIKVHDVLITTWGDRFGEVTMRDGHTTPGVVYLYFDGHEGPPADMVVNHADRLLIQGPLIEEPTRSMEFVLEVSFAPTDLGAQDLIESSLRDALEGIKWDGLELDTPHDLTVNGDKVGSWGVRFA